MWESWCHNSFACNKALELLIPCRVYVLTPQTAKFCHSICHLVSMTTTVGSTDVNAVVVVVVVAVVVVGSVEVDVDGGCSVDP